jgi:hypothetical protein
LSGTGSGAFIPQGLILKQCILLTHFFLTHATYDAS